MEKEGGERNKSPPQRRQWKRNVLEIFVAKRKRVGEIYQILSFEYRVVAPLASAVPPLAPPDWQPPERSPPTSATVHDRPEDLAAQERSREEAAKQVSSSTDGERVSFFRKDLDKNTFHPYHERKAKWARRRRTRWREEESRLEEHNAEEAGHDRRSKGSADGLVN